MMGICALQIHAILTRNFFCLFDFFIYLFFFRLLCVFSNETQPSTCDDSIDCTRDFCEASTCVHKPIHEICQSGGLCEEFCDVRWGCQSLTCQIPTVQPTIEKLPNNDTIPKNTPPPPGKKSHAPKLSLTLYALFALQFLLFILFE